MEGYEAGQKLLAAGSVGNSDPTLQRLLVQLKNKGMAGQAECGNASELRMGFKNMERSCFSNYSRT
jgi:hypothetical protein